MGKFTAFMSLLAGQIFAISKGSSLPIASFRGTNACTLQINFHVRAGEGR